MAIELLAALPLPAQLLGGALLALAGVRLGRWLLALSHPLAAPVIALSALPGLYALTVMALSVSLQQLILAIVMLQIALGALVWANQRLERELTEQRINGRR